MNVTMHHRRTGVRLALAAAVLVPQLILAGSVAGQTTANGIPASSTVHSMSPTSDAAMSLNGNVCGGGNCNGN